MSEGALLGPETFPSVDTGELGVGKEAAESGQIGVSYP